MDLGSGQECKSQEAVRRLLSFRWERMVAQVEDSPPQDAPLPNSRSSPAMPKFAVIWHMFMSLMSVSPMGL